MKVSFNRFYLVPKIPYSLSIAVELNNGPLGFPVSSICDLLGFQSRLTPIVIETSMRVSYKNCLSLMVEFDDQKLSRRCLFAEG